MKKSKRKKKLRPARRRQRLGPPEKPKDPPSVRIYKEDELPRLIELGGPLALYLDAKRKIWFRHYPGQILNTFKTSFSAWAADLGVDRRKVMRWLKTLWEADLLRWTAELNKRGQRVFWLPLHPYQPPSLLELEEQMAAPLT